VDKIQISFDHNGIHYEGWLKPVSGLWPPVVYQVVLNGVFVGTLTLSEEWELDSEKDQKLAPLLGNYIELWYQ
jgi:hypothetical protein